MDVPLTQYARNGERHVAYQALGAGPLDVMLVPIPIWSSEAAWDVPGLGELLRRVASFGRLIVFDRRGSGMSDGPSGAASLEEQLDDILAVMDAVGSQQVALLGFAEGGALATLFAASHPRLTRALVLMTPVPRALWARDYPWAPTTEQRAAITDAFIAHWGSEDPGNPLIRYLGTSDAQTRRAVARMQRMAMSPGDAAAVRLAMDEYDVRPALPSVQCPTLVLRREGDLQFDARHSRYAADHIAGAEYVELGGEGPVPLGDVGPGADLIQEFLTGSRPPVVSDRVLATVLFTDIVGSTERAAAMADRPWRELLGRHDDLVRTEIERHRGRFVKSLGDGVLATFDGPSRAITGARAISSGVRAMGLQIRAGLHSGECELLGDHDVGGLAVHIAARICALAGPGEVLVSSTVRDLSVGSGHALIDRGERELHGVPDPWRIFALEQ